MPETMHKKEERTMRNLAAAFVLGAALSAAAVVHAEEMQFTVANLEYEGTKIWVPSTLVVHKGDKVKIKLINNVKADPNQHGYKIAAFNVEAVVTRGEPQNVEFTADKAGIFPITCQLHPAHVGGELVVLDQ
jgi:heme/copper-type cytochrome/quinol oxidase subunit 2